MTPEAVTPDAVAPELDAALDGLLAVAGHVRAADLDRPTPCDGWDVRRLMEHLVGWQRVFAACSAGAAPPFDGGSPTYRASADPVADLRASSAGLAAALRAGGDPVDLPYRGPTPVAAHVEELVAETVLHTWDLGTAIGRRPEPDADVLAVAHRGLTRLLGAPFAPVAFDDAPARTSATDLAGLLARSGRTG